MQTPSHTLEPAWSAAELALSLAVPARLLALSCAWPVVSLAVPVRSLAFDFAASV